MRHEVVGDFLNDRWCQSIVTIMSDPTRNHVHDDKNFGSITKVQFGLDKWTHIFLRVLDSLLDSSEQGLENSQLVAFRW